MARPVLLPYRWVGHGLDIRAFIDDDEPFFAAADVAKAIGFPVLEFHDAFWDTWSYTYPLPTQLLEGCDEEVFTVDQVRELALDRPMFLEPSEPTGDFLTWFDDLVASMRGPQLERIVAAATPADPGAAAPITYSVARAARLLTRDPVIEVGEKSLFAHMQELGWVARDSTFTWVPAPELVKSGTLTRRLVRVPGKKSLYPQIRVTPAGIEKLHASLGGIATVPLNDTPHLTLVELP